MFPFTDFSLTRKTQIPVIKGQFEFQCQDFHDKE